MTALMERNKKTPLLFLPLALLCVSAVREEKCPSVPNKNLTCYTDYNRHITCEWNSTSVSDHPDNVCTIDAKITNLFFTYSNSCTMEPVDISRRMLKKCFLTFNREGRFQTFHNLSLHLSCKPVNQSLHIYYKPACHIKLNPPQQPQVNFTTVSWFSQVTRHKRISHYSSQLQWKQEDQSWSENHSKTAQCRWHCTVELEPDLLIQGQRYEARVRVKAMEEGTESIWSDWSPTASWVSHIGTKPPPSDLPVGVLAIAGGVAAFAVFLVVIRFKTDKTTWVYMVKRIRGPPLPNPKNSFLQEVKFQSWLSPHFTSESFHSFYKPVEIISVEVTSTVDMVAPCRPEAALLEKMRSESSKESTNSNFSNPSYSQLCPTPPPPPLPLVSMLTAGNLAPCATDTPYGPVGSQGGGNNAEQDIDEVRGKEIRQLLSKGSNNSEPMLVISDYEKAEKLQVGRVRLQSLDSGVCSGEEVSQESLEADSINVTDEGHEGEDERKGGNGKDLDFHKLFASSAGVFGKGSIQVCSGYEQVQKLQDDSPELPSQDSGINSGVEEQASQEESLEDVDKSTESTSFLFSPLPLPPPSSSSPCFLPSFTPLPSHFCGPSLSPTLCPLQSNLLERTTLMSSKRSVESSGDGYMPIRQEQN